MKGRDTLSLASDQQLLLWQLPLTSASATVSHFGKLDVLVNNAGIYRTESSFVTGSELVIDGGRTAR